MTRLRHHTYLRPLPRAASWLLALLCLWMGSGGVLHHTEDLPFAGVRAPQADGGHVLLAPADDGCAACQWTQGVQCGPPPLAHVVLAFAFAAAPAGHASERLLSRLPSRLSLRGPPALLS